MSRYYPPPLKRLLTTPPSVHGSFNPMGTRETNHRLHYSKNNGNSNGKCSVLMAHPCDIKVEISLRCSIMLSWVNPHPKYQRVDLKSDWENEEKNNNTVPSLLVWFLSNQGEVCALSSYFFPLPPSSSSEGERERWRIGSRGQEVAVHQLRWLLRLRFPDRQTLRRAGSLGAKFDWISSPVW